MQNIQDLKEKIFFESKNIIDILEKISNVDELLSKQSLVDELANRISFLRLLEKNIEYFVTDSSNQNSENQQSISSVNNSLEAQEPKNEVTEEEAVFNNQLNEIDESEPSNYQENILSFVDEERILANSKPENDEDIHEEIFTQETTEEEMIFNSQLNEIERFENEPSDYQGDAGGSFDEEEKIQFSFESEAKKAVANEIPEATETIPSIFDTEILEDEEFLIEENEDQFIAPNVSIEQGEMVTEISNVENILEEIKNDAQIEEKQEQSVISEENSRRKIVEIGKPEVEKENPASDESFENLEAYQQEKKIKLSNIKGLKAVQTLFDDDPLERKNFQEKPASIVKEDSEGIIRTNIPTDYMEAEKPKPEFKLDLNDRIAFSKMLFEGSQSELNKAVAELNRFRTLEEAKEYLSELYYEKKWSKADEYAQRLWGLVENKFL